MPYSVERAIDDTRRRASKQLDPSRRSQLGQFMTPTGIADFMASRFTRWPDRVRLLDPGAGIGSLTEAFATRFTAHAAAGASLEVHCYEIEPLLLDYLADHLSEIEAQLKKQQHPFSSRIHDRDFIDEASFELGMGGPRFTHAILNPPYKKINAGSMHRKGGEFTCLNSSAADQRFRSFSGHTQVNAADLRAMRYPSRADLIRLGKWARKQKELPQAKINAMLGFTEGRAC